MKNVYWRPEKASPTLIALIAIAAIGGLTLIELLPATERQDDYDLKLAAAKRAGKAMMVIKREKLRRGHRPDPRFDPGRTGLIGEAMTPVTSLPASLRAKQTSVNPNFAAAVVEMLGQAGVERGDCVAVGYTGSFPALDLCVCAALETLQVRPIIIASAASSQFGANDPDLLWLDMERILFDQGIISFRSTAASLGGFGDRGRGMSALAAGFLLAGIERNHLRRLNAETLAEAIDQRMRVYRTEAHSAPIKAYINVGGGAASLRGRIGRHLYAPGLNRTAPAGAAQADSVMTRFALQGTPVINLVQAEKLADQYGFPRAPAVLPPVGTGTVFVRTVPRRWLAAALLLALLGCLHAFVLRGLGQRIAIFFRRHGRSGPAGPQLATVGPQLKLKV